MSYRSISIRNDAPFWMDLSLTARVETSNPGGDSKPGALVMCDIPVDLERRFERRWTARFSDPAKERRLETQRQHQRLTTTDKSKTKTPRREPAGSRARI
jgi:hypothetical protein